MDDKTEFEASSQGWIDAAVEQQVRRKRAEERILEVEAERDAAMRAVDENWITHQRVVAAEAALPAVYRLALGDAHRQVVISGKKHAGLSASRVTDAICATIRALPTPTTAELMARIHTGDKE